MLVSFCLVVLFTWGQYSCFRLSPDVTKSIVNTEDTSPTCDPFLSLCEDNHCNNMPEAFPATVAEREAELVALQSAFDEYIASSRELEEELDAELAKMRKYLPICISLLVAQLSLFCRRETGRIHCRKCRLELTVGEHCSTIKFSGSCVD